MFEFSSGMWYEEVWYRGSGRSWRQPCHPGREADGAFKSFADLLERVEYRLVNKKGDRESH